MERRPLLADLIAKRLKEMIANGELTPGQQLPSEAELAERFGVARSTVREAKKALALIGLLDVHVGKGSYVHRTALRRLEFEQVLDQSRVSLPEIYEGRRILEGGIAALAAERATEQDIHDMRLAVERMESAARAADSLGVFAADSAFHVAMVRAAHNEYLYRAFDGTRGLIQEMIARMSQVPESIVHTTTFHRDILAAVEVRDADRAREIVQQLLDGSQRSIETQLE